MCPCLHSISFTANDINIIVVVSFNSSIDCAVDILRELTPEQGFYKYGFFSGMNALRNRMAIAILE